MSEMEKLLNAENGQLREALREAIKTIQIFHGRPGWEIYRDQSAEMKRWNALLAANMSREGTNG